MLLCGGGVGARLGPRGAWSPRGTKIVGVESKGKTMRSEAGRGTGSPRTGWPTRGVTVRRGVAVATSAGKTGVFREEARARGRRRRHGDSGGLVPPGRRARPGGGAVRRLGPGAGAQGTPSTVLAGADVLGKTRSEPTPGRTRRPLLEGAGPGRVGANRVVGFVRSRSDRGKGPPESSVRPASYINRPCPQGGSVPFGHPGRPQPAALPRAPGDARPTGTKRRDEDAGKKTAQAPSG